MSSTRSRACESKTSGSAWSIPAARTGRSAMARCNTRRSDSRGTPLMHVPLQVVGKTFGRGGEPGVFGHMRGVDAVMIGQRQRPGAARLDRNRFDIEAGQRAGGEQRIAQQITVMNFLHGDDCF